jgi:hypothetical protein
MADSASPLLAQPISVWSDGLRNFQIYLRPRVMGRLGTEAWVGFKRVPRRGLEIGGVLLGRTERREDTTTFWIEGFTAVESEHRSGPSYVPSDADLVRLQDEVSRNGSASIGLFRSQTRSEQLVLQEPDTALLERYFSSRDSLFLMVGPVPGKAALFVGTNGNLHCVHEFALGSLTSVLKGSQNGRSQEIDAPPNPMPEVRITRLPRTVETPKHEMPGAIEPLKDEAAPPPFSANNRSVDAPEHPIVEPLEEFLSAGPADLSRWKRRKLGTWIVTVTLAVLLISAAFSVRSYSSRHSIGPVRSALEYIQLGVEREGSILRVHWDRNSPTLRNANRAVLHVQDGEAQADRVLTASDLDAGSTTYEPKNSELAFRLDVYSAEPGATGLVQVMNLLKPADISQPAPPAPRIQPQANRAPEVRSPASTRIENFEPIAAQPLTKADVAAKISHVASDSNDVSNHETATAAPTAAERIQTKPAAAPEVSAPTTAEKPSQPQVAAATERAPLTASTSRPSTTSSSALSNRGPSVSVLAEPVSGSKLAHVVGRIPLFRRLKSHDNIAAPVPVYQAQPSLKLPNQQHVTEPVSVDVKVDVAESGKVRSAEVVQYGEPPNFSLANAALAAARQWTFQPARFEDLPISSEVLLHFRFNP